MNKTLSLLVLPIILGLAMDVAARGRPNFTYLQAQFVGVDIGDSACDTMTGVEFSGSLLTNDQMFVTTSYMEVDDENGCESDTMRVGAGLRASYGRTASLYGSLSLVSLDGGNDTDTGLGFAAGVRAFVTEGFEVGLHLAQDSVDESDQTYVSLTGAYWLTDTLSLIGSITVADENNTFSEHDNTQGSIGVRFTL